MRLPGLNARFFLPPHRLTPNPAPTPPPSSPLSGGDDAADTNGTLRWAILTANALPAASGRVSILLAPPLGDIALDLPLPNVSRPAGDVDIVGEAQGTTLVRLFPSEGASAEGRQGGGLTITSPNTRVSGLELRGFGSAALSISAPGAVLESLRLARNAMGIELLAGASHAQLTNVNIMGAWAGAGLAVDGAANVTATACAVRGSFGDGAFLQSAASVTLRGCVFENNTRHGVLASNVRGLALEKSSAATSGQDGALLSQCSACVIDGCSFHANGRFGMYLLESPNAALLNSHAAANANEGVYVFSSPTFRMQGCSVGAALPSMAPGTGGNGASGLTIIDSEGGLVGDATACLRQAARPSALPLGPRGNVFVSNGVDGIFAQGTAGLRVCGNFLGVQAGASSPQAGNARFGLVVFSVANAGAGIHRNVIGANGQDGVLVQSSAAITLSANFIGLAADGRTRAGNGRYGVLLVSTATSVTIGGPGAASGNVIANNGVDAILVSEAVGVLVSNNLIGLAADGLTAAGNLESGIQFGTVRDSSITGNTVGANGQHGIVVDASSNIQLLQNVVGLDVEQLRQRGNGRIGILVLGGASRVVVGGANVVAFSGGEGIYLQDVTDVDVAGNYVGITPGRRAAGNGVDGIYLLRASACSLSQNTVAHNQLDGISLSEAAQVTLAGNSVHFSSRLGLLILGSPGTRVQNNIVGGSGQDGLFLQSSPGCTIEDNRLGFDPAGQAPLGNARYGANVRTSGNVTLRRNAIAVSGEHGIVLDSSPGATVQANFLGLDAQGRAGVNRAYGNGRDGMDIIVGSDDAVVTDNTVAGNGEDGIYAQGVLRLHIHNNTCGRDAAGAAAGNGKNAIACVLAQDVLVSHNDAAASIGGSGIHLESSARVEVVANMAGGSVRELYNTASGIRLIDATDVRLSNNTIAGNGQHGVQALDSSFLHSEGDRVGVSPTAGGPVGNGMHIDRSTHNVTIAGAILAHSGGFGVLVTGGAANVTLHRTVIGSGGGGSSSGNARGGVALRDASEVLVRDCHIIGNGGNGVDVGEGFAGLRLLSSHIGSNSSGARLPNRGDGVFVAQGARNIAIGALAAPLGSHIAFNGGAGVRADVTQDGSPAILSTPIFGNGDEAVQLTCLASGCPLRVQLLAAFAAGREVEGVVAHSRASYSGARALLQIFGSASCAAAATSGEGMALLYTAVVLLADAGRQMRFALTLPPTVNVGEELQQFSATVTVLRSGAQGAGGTSPFAACLRRNFRYEACNVCRCARDVVDCSGRGLLLLPDTFPPGTQTLDLSQNPYLDLSNWPINVTAALPSLTRLVLRAANVQRLEPTWFAGHPSLSVLDLSDNTLGAPGLAGWDLGSVPRLTQLLLDNAGLQALPPNFTAGALQLTRLSLAGNNISQLQAGMVSRAPNLQQLSLAYNPLRRVADTAFFELQALQTLDLRPPASDTGSSAAQPPLLNISRTVFQGMRNLAAVQWFTEAFCPQGYAPGFAMSGICLRCPRGTHSDGLTAGSLLDCSACPAGTADEDEDAVTPCTPCNPGSFTAEGSAGSCLRFACPAGTADADRSANTPCDECAAGTYAAPGAAGPEGCAACAAGTTDHDMHAATPCVACLETAAVPPGAVGPCVAQAARRRISKKATVALGVSLCILAVVLLLTALIMRRRLRRTRKKHRAELTELHRQAQAEFEQIVSLQAEDVAAHFMALQIERESLTCIRTLGEGEFGVVELCSLGNRGLEVAVKRMHASGVDFEAQKTFLLEAKIMAALSHEAIVAVRGLCTEEMPFILVMELMALGDLRNYLRKAGGSSPPETALLTGSCWQLSTAMTYLEDLGVVHRDLAARNVLVGEGGLPNVKLGDFGMSRPLDERQYYRKTSADRVPVKWMAPESLRFKTYSHKSDVWSFGILLWEVYSMGAAPYAELTAMEAMLAVAAGHRLSQPRDCPDGVFRVMKQMWHADADIRPPFLAVEAMLRRELGNAGNWTAQRDNAGPGRPREVQRRSTVDSLAPEASPALLSVRKPSIGVEDIDDGDVRHIEADQLAPPRQNAALSRKGSASSFLSGDSRHYPRIPASLARAAFSSILNEDKQRRKSSEDGVNGRRRQLRRSTEFSGDGSTDTMDSPPVAKRRTLTSPLEDNYIDPAETNGQGQQRPSLLQPNGGMRGRDGGRAPSSPLAKSLDSHYEYEDLLVLETSLADAERAAAGAPAAAGAVGAGGARPDQSEAPASSQGQEAAFPGASAESGENEVFEMRRLGGASAGSAEAGSAEADSTLPAEGEGGRRSAASSVSSDQRQRARQRLHRSEAEDEDEQVLRSGRSRGTAGQARDATKPAAAAQANAGQRSARPRRASKQRRRLTMVEVDV